MSLYVLCLSLSLSSTQLPHVRLHLIHIHTVTFTYIHTHTTRPQHTRADTFLCLNVFLFALLFKGCFWGCTIQRADDTTPDRTATTLLATTHRASPMLLCPVVPVLCLLLRKRDNDAWWFREQACALCTFLWVYVRVSIYLSVCNVSKHVLSVRFCGCMCVSIYLSVCNVSKHVLSVRLCTFVYVFVRLCRCARAGRRWRCRALAGCLGVCDFTFFFSLPLVTCIAYF